MTTNDHHYLEKLEYDNNTIYVFDKGHNDHKAFKHFTENKTGFVAPLKYNAVYEKSKIKEIPESILSGVLQDELVEIEVKEEKKYQN